MACRGNVLYVTQNFTQNTVIMSILPAIDVVSIWCNRETAAATEPQFKKKKFIPKFSYADRFKFVEADT